MIPAIVVEVKALPSALRSALASLGYGKRDIRVSAADTVSLQDFGSAGCRSFVCIVNLETGERETRHGSWGGPGVGSANNPVDLDSRQHRIPLNGAVISGAEGGGQPVYASVKVNPANLAKLLPPSADVTEKEKSILRVFRGYKAGEYRKAELARLDTASEDLAALVGKGLLKQNAAGATQITTAGKNAAN
jgi:hypothetical protein